MKSKKLLLFIIGIIALVPMLVLVYKLKQPAPSNYPMVQYNAPGPKSMSVGEELKVGSIEILDGHVFYALLENSEWHELRLSHVTKDEATTPVLELLQKATQPSVVLRRKVGNTWYVDFNLTLEGKRITLLEWLAEKKLTL